MFQLKSDSYEGKGDEELIYSVRFFYPTATEKIPTMKGATYSDLISVNPEAVEDQQAVTNNFKRGTVLNFDYSMTGNNKNIKLRKAFDDGISTYFEFSDKNLIPAIYYVDLDGKENILKYFRDGPYIVVNTVQMQYSLRITGEVLCIFNNVMLY
jgi:type IV secretory pathway VirB9-like protein